MSTPTLPLARLAAALLVLLTLPAFAADAPAGFSRQVVLDQALATPGKHGVMAVVEFQPGAAAPRHTHPGEELIYVIAGTVRLEIDGQPPRDLHAGEAALVPARTPHGGHNGGATPARIVSTYFVDQGEPLATPVK